MSFNPAKFNLLKNYSSRQIDQLFRAGSTLDVGSSEHIQDRDQSSGLSAGIFSRLLNRSPDQENSREITEGESTVEDTCEPDSANIDDDDGYFIADLDESSRLSHDISESRTLMIDQDEDSQHSINVDWDQLPEEPQENQRGHRILETGYCAIADTEQTVTSNSETITEQTDTSINGTEQTETSNETEQTKSSNETEQTNASNETELTNTRTTPADSGKKHELLSPCGCARLKCTLNISEEERKHIHSNYWSLDYSGRRSWLKSNMSEKVVNRHRGSTGSRKEKKSSWTYSLAGKVVCKSMFLRTLGMYFYIDPYLAT